MHAAALALATLLLAAEPAATPPAAQPRAAPAAPHRAGPDPLDLVWGHRLQFAPGGAPLVTIRIAEGREEIRFRTRSPARLRPRHGSEVELPAGATLRVRARGAQPAAIAHHVILAERELADHAGLAAARALWKRRGLETRERIVGGVYGLAGKVVDNRRTLLLAGGGTSAEDAAALADRIQQQHGARPPLFGELIAPPRGTLEIATADGAPLAVGEGLVELVPEADAGFELDEGAATGERYRGGLVVTIDAAGRLAAVNAVTLEALLRGIVPSEIPAGSPAEALKAQAVTARSNVLAQIGTRHLTDPYVLCDEVHCQAYHGERAEHPATDAAVRATAGEAIFDARATLVDGVYSAVCGGHGEDNDAVWKNLPSPSLRGRPDLPAAAASRWAGGLQTGAKLREFLDHAPQGWCAAAPKRRYRWTRRFSPAEMNAIGGELGVGAVRRLAVLRRGVSGRAVALEVRGSARRVVLEGELRIRRAFRNLDSAMFLVSRDADGWLFRGGGWGHGAGMCQWGAVGRARAGQDYREILRAYFSGAEIARIGGR